MKSIKLDNGELFFDEAGDGEPILFLHASIADSRMWQLQVDYFSQRYRTVVCDLRGYGRSPLPNGSFAHYADIKSLLDALAIKATYVVGASFGGRVALDFCLMNPDRVKALVLVATAIGGYKPSQAVKEFALREDQLLAAGKIQKATDLNVRMWVDGPNRDQDAVDPDVRKKVAEMQFLAFSQPIPPNVQIKRVTPPAIDRLHELGAPTLVISGDQDEQSFVQLAAKLASTVQGAKQLVIAGAGHLVSMEAPDEFNAAVDEFLQSIPS